MAHLQTGTHDWDEFWVLFGKFWKNYKNYHHGRQGALRGSLHQRQGTETGLYHKLALIEAKERKQAKKEQPAGSRWDQRLLH